MRTGGAGGGGEDVEWCMYICMYDVCEMDRG